MPSLSLGVFALTFGPCRFLDPGDGRGPLDWDRFDTPDALRCFLVDARFSSPDRTAPFSSSVIAVTREIIRGVGAVARRECTVLDLSDDGEFTLDLTPLALGGGLWRASCAGFGEERKSQDRLLVELCLLIGGLERSCANAGISYESLLARAPSEVTWTTQGG
jgi:hypothetical protein